MDPRLVTFGLMQGGVTLYALWRGGWPERCAALATSLALVAGWLMPFNPYTAYRHIELARFAIDVGLLGALLAVALTANRFWPLWIAALQLLALGIHGVRGYDPVLLPIVYNRLVGWLAYPILILIAVGTWRYARREERRRAAGAT